LPYHVPLRFVGKGKGLMLRDKIKDALKLAMKARDARRVGTLRLILAAIKDRDIAMRTEDATEKDDDAVIMTLLGKMIKQRNDSIQAYEEGGRLELAEQEKEEIEIINEFLPKQMSDGEIAAAAKKAVAEAGAESLKDMGTVMGILKSRHAGAMDFAKASKAVKDLLS